MIIATPRANSFTIEIPDFISQSPEFQPLWAWIVAACIAWYVIMGLIMRFGGQGKRIASEWQGYRFPNDHLFDYVKDTARLAVLSRLALSPLEYLAWHPLKAIAKVVNLFPSAVARMISGKPDSH